MQPSQELKAELPEKAIPMLGRRDEGKSVPTEEN